MPDQEIDQHLLKLSKGTENMKRRFQFLVTKFKKYVSERYDLEKVVDVLIEYDRNKFHLVLSDCSTLNDCFQKIVEYYSFYDYDVIKVLITSLGSEENKKDLKKYKSKFHEFWKKRICEIPCDAFGDATESEKFRVKIDKDIEEVVGEDIETLKYEMRRILGHKLQFLYVKEGCVELTFRSYEPISDLTKTQQLKVMKHTSILSLSYGELSMKFDSGRLII